MPMGRLFPLLALADLAILVIALIDCLSVEEDEIRALPRVAWVFIILLFSPVGGIAWFVAGRPQRTRQPSFHRTPCIGEQELRTLMSRTWHGRPKITTVISSRLITPIQWRRSIGRSACASEILSIRGPGTAQPPLEQSGAMRLQHSAHSAAHAELPVHVMQVAMNRSNANA